MDHGNRKISKTFQQLINFKTFRLPPMEMVMKNFDSRSKVVTARQLKVMKEDPTDFRQILQRVKAEGDKNIIVSVSIDILPEVLKQAQQVGILTEFHQYIVTTLDMHTLDLYPYQHGGTNITGPVIELQNSVLNI